MQTDRPRKISKRRLAEIQLLRAVKVLVEDNDPVSSLTLSGAAENLLGDMLRALNKPHAFKLVVDRNKKMWTHAAKIAAKSGGTINVPDDKELERRANFTRNGLKHGADGRPLLALYGYQAEEMIDRALANYRILYGKMPPQKYVSNWYENLIR
jgi:hypothetical protein